MEVSKIDQRESGLATARSMYNILKIECFFLGKRLENFDILSSIDTIVGRPAKRQGLRECQCCVFNMFLIVTEPL